MITQAILYVICTPVLLLLDILPNVSVEIPSTAFDNIDSFFSLLGYVFPMTTLVTIIGIKISLKLAKITIALIVRIKSFIPTMGA